MMKHMGNDEVTADSKAGTRNTRKVTQHLAALCVNIGSFCLGNVLAWTSPTSASLQQPTPDAPTDSSYISQSEWSWVGSLMNIGAAVMVLPTGYLVERLGRKVTVLCMVLPFTAGWFIIAWAEPDRLAMFYVGRILTGAMGGTFSLTAPVYSTEIAEKEIRGNLAGYFQLLLTIGILFVYVVGSAVSAQVLSIICGVMPLLLGATLFFMPETPMYLVQKGMSDKARKSLEFFRGKNCDVEAELQELQSLAEAERLNKLSFRDVFKTAAAKRSLFVSLGLMTFLQLGGVNAVIFYTSDIFTAAGSTLKPEHSTIIVGAIQVVATFTSTMIVDRVGRRILLLISGSLMSLCTLLLGVFFYLQSSGQDSENIGWLPLTSLCLFFVGFSVGYGPVPWIMVGELFPSKIKGFAVSMACTLSWIFSFIVTKFFSDLALAAGNHTIFWIFAGVSAVGCLFVAFLAPETKGKSFEQIQQELSNRKQNKSEARIGQKNSE